MRHIKKKKAKKINRAFFIVRDYVVPILVSLIGMFGALGGVYIANSHNAEQAREERLSMHQSKLIEQRVLILDRAAKIFGQSPGLQDSWYEYLKELKVDTRNFDSMIVEKITQAQGEFQSITILAWVYFGPKTRNALNELSEIKGPWWAKPKEKQDEFIAAMAQEINYQIQ